MASQEPLLKNLNSQIINLAQKHANRPEALLDILREAQEQQGWLSRETILNVAQALRIPPEKVYGVATFYSMLSLSPRKETVIRLCDGPVCWLNGASDVREVLERKSQDEKPASTFTLERTSCLGLCDRAPAALVGDQQVGPLKLDDIPRLRSGWHGVPPDYSQPRPGEVRVMMANAGKVDPDSIESALALGAYQALNKALSLSPEEIIREIEESGLVGRGGAGFPVGRKWRFVAQAQRVPHYVICNADESEPLIFKDRVLIDTNPHQILEGMAIAGYATGSNEAFIYIRGEYFDQAKRLERAIQQAEALGWLGDNIQGSGFSFRIHIHRGAGAYICGEETALIESLEGKRGEPRPRPPYPPSHGYRGYPTLVNNVESYAAVPAIILNGSTWYRSIGNHSPESSITPGTKLYMILGHVNHPGLFEAPFGLSLREIINEFGGGMRPGSEFHFALTGGAAGTIVSSALLDIPIDYASVTKGISLGAGAFLICDQSVSPIALLRQLLHFFRHESCGKCTPCRIGTYQSLQILDRLVEGKGRPGDIEQLARLADTMQVASFCGLGQSVAIPVKSALTHFNSLFISATE